MIRKSRRRGRRRSASDGQTSTVCEVPFDADRHETLELFGTRRALVVKGIGGQPMPHLLACYNQLLRLHSSLTSVPGDGSNHPFEVLIGYLFREIPARHGTKLFKALRRKLGPGAEVLRLDLRHWKGEVRVKSAECYNGEHTNIVKRQINRNGMGWAARPSLQGTDG